MNVDAQVQVIPGPAGMAPLTRPSLPPSAFAAPFEVLPTTGGFYIGDQNGAAVEWDNAMGKWGDAPTYATREEAEKRIGEIMDKMDEL
jgi:hypothetical protein